jgi:hypothetical protein
MPPGLRLDVSFTREWGGQEPPSEALDYTSQVGDEFVEPDMNGTEIGSRAITKVRNESANRYRSLIA